MPDAQELFANNFATTLSAPIGQTDTSATITTLLPTALQSTGQFRLRLGTVLSGEWVTASVGSSSTTLVLTRGVEGSSGQAWPAGTPVAQLLTAGALQELQADAIDAAAALIPAGIITAAPAAVSAAASQSVAGVPLTNPYGLRRWRAAYADAFNGEAHIVCVVDSHTFGQNADGTNTSLNTQRATDNQLGYVGQLRKRFAQVYGDAGEGFIFPANSAESRITEAGTPLAFLAPGQSPSVNLFNRRLTSTGQTLTLTIPTGCTRLQVTQANAVGNNSSTWSLNGSGQGAISTLTNTGLPVSTYLTVVAGQVVVITGPSSGNDTIINLAFRTAQTSGVVVHNLGVGGQTQWRLMGGVFNGIVGTNDGSTIYTNAQQIANVRACYQHTGATKGLLIIYTGTNEQSNQLLSSGLNCGVSPTIMAQGVQFMVNQAATDGWCTLLVGPPPSASEVQTTGAALLSTYTAHLQTIAATTDHCAMIDLADLWGADNSAGKLAASNAGLRDSGSSHPTRAGYGDIAHHVYRVLDMVVPVGN